MGDLEDIIPAFTSYLKDSKFMDCSAFVKLSDDNEHLSVGHNTYNIYSLMLRVYKTYNFTLSNPLVKAKIQSFSSRPGDMESKDDFYVLSSNLVVVETSLNNYNPAAYAFLNYTTLPTWLRVNLANRASATASDWSLYFSKHHSGTHNNQWTIIDYNVFQDMKNKKNFDSSAEGLAFLVEEFSYLMQVTDITQWILKDRYFASYNIPIDPDIYNLSNYTGGWHYNYTNDPRHDLFFSMNITSAGIEGVRAALRYNNNETGDPCQSIAPRCDITKDMSSRKGFGAIDAKAVDERFVANNSVWMISSPTHKYQPPFSFTGEYTSDPHMGMPNTYNFSWVLYDQQSFSQLMIQPE